MPFILYLVRFCSSKSCKKYAIVLYCTVRVPYCISNNIPRDRTRTSTGTVSALPNLIVNSAGTVPYE